jgi:predicted DNA-binding protein
MRITPALKRRLKAAAHRKGLSASVWVRLAISEALREQAAEEVGDKKLRAWSKNAARKAAET